MNKPSTSFALTPALRGVARAVLCVFTLAAISPVPHAYAEVADLARVPLTTSSTSVVKPNLMFILDDSGSMGRDFTPEYVNDSGTTAGCYDGGDDSSGTITGAADACVMGDPPYTSPDFNTQYYNPEFTYTPPSNADGTSKASIGSPWTAVPVDGFGAQSSSTINLVTNYPDRQWCTASSGGTCVKNADYTYPDATNPFARSATGAPYYYRIVPNEHCTTADLASCIVSAAPTGTHPFPAKTRWCDSVALTNCQARRVGNFFIPKHLGTVNPGGAGSAAVAATGSITIGDSGSNNSVNISSLTVNGVNIISSTITAAGGTNTSAERVAAAQALCNEINSFVSAPDYQARNTGSGTTCSSSGSRTVTIVAATTGAAPNGFVVTPGSSAVGTTAATATVTLSSVSAGATIGSVTIGGVAVTAGTTLTENSGSSNSTTRRNNLRAQLTAAIQSFTSSPEYTAVNGGSTGQTVISALVAEGANANGRIITISGVTSATVAITDCTSPSVTDAMCGGVTSGGIPVTVTNMTGGADAVAAAVAFREGTGTWSRTDIVSTNNSYPRATTRTDCVGATCTFVEEMTNFANWYAYYRTRMQMMKSSAGRAFVSLGDSYRVGFTTLNPDNNPSGQAPSGSEFVAIGDFGTTKKTSWYTRFYGIVPNSGTPLREALSRVGRYYGNVTTGINAGMTDDPVQYSCQQNIAILTTDGFWNGNAGQTLTGGSIGNQDNADSGFSTRAVGAFDGGLGGTASSSTTGSADTLADVAMYYYKTDLRSSGAVSADNVPASGKDNAPHQHMTTFTLGLGLDGVMNYRPDYETAGTGDFANIVSTTANDCGWAPGTSVKCNWPQARADTPTALDDLWHAAVNGRGTYFSARDPNALFTGLTNALASVAIRTGAAAASATSSPNVTPTDRAIYSSTYRTQIWDGEIVAQLIDTATGVVLPGVTWSAQSLLDTLVLASSDTRTIYTFDASASNKLKAFTHAALSATERAYFTDRVCVTTTPVASPSEPLAQCTLGMPDADKVAANDPLNLIPYLRGQTSKESTLYRAREHTLGDTVNATPAYVRLPTNTFTDTDYATFKAAQTSADRAPALYVAANDGMLHAFNGLTGVETWAFVPRAIFPTLYKLAATDYATTHRYFVDGSPVAADVYDRITDPSVPVWKTIVVGGLGGGGRGFYALDVTDPAAPKALWEFCTDAALCSVTDADLGFASGNPVITQRDSDKRWVVLVTSGYNNVPDATDLFPDTGDGKGYLYVLDAITGAILQKIDTGAGSVSTPSGLAKISAYAESFGLTNTSRLVYGGDLLGNVWRFDLTASPATVMRLATLKDGSGTPRPQSITTRPELASINSTPVLFIGTGRYLGANDLPDGATLTPALPYAYQNSMYAFMDTQTDLGDLRIRSDIQSRTLTTPTVTTRSTSSTPVMDWTTQKGWRLDFNPGTSPGDSPGERLNIDPQLILGTLIFATNVPANTACSVGGDSWLYQLNYLEGTYVSTSPDNVAATKSSNATVGFVVVRLPDGSVKIIKTDSTGIKETKGANIGSGSAGGRRVSWRELIN